MRDAPLEAMRRLLAAWFLLQTVGLGALAALTTASDRENPLGATWLMGALITWVAWRVTLEHGPVRGALASQALLCWLPFFVAVFAASHCLTGLLRQVEQLEVVLALNGAALALTVGAHFARP